MLTKCALENITRAESMNLELLITGAPNSYHESSYHLDVVNAEESEPFTLESFRKSIIEALKNGKEYILAKVTTSDPTNATSLYNYYYSAFEINKILFKYEADRHLLHRMKVRNPMNNMFIMGQVYYYKIGYDSLEVALQEYDHPSVESSRGKMKAFSEILPITRNTSSSYIDGLSVKKEPELRSISRDLFETLAHPQESVINTDKKLRIRAVYFANDGDFLVKSGTREFFKRNAVNPDDYFIFKLERTQNDFLALLDSPTGSESNDEAETWKRALTAHLSFILVIMCLLLFLGTFPLVFFVVFPLVILFLLSMLFSLFYIFCCRRRTFGSIDVNDVAEV
ncbi:hypothetical protein NEPAR06_1139 [Nematocida parisii]|uniref:uncharacterized protein n=1 Tax=Nematocida parisii (strain ERTm1 / ATCC PRA-289) TaxID=881290 RepID=UPI000264B3AA|nr:uncharacterized protein NEPG_01709 [Nematocida parisii ERTm1]KAI5125935.1 hypothetical protein NEPAR08_0271 [Nematocida parisii]EIJ93367.1 hypothetical protein NEPG_01709 [Nematocida parisii ERTm1]KAI5126200.1 hypothetical protein NEPAR03_0372 [Nematocida parisii]KAI5140445.1 hypothetical protein NEPAR04_0277 [Nematocida parisii]KAI5144392.1 hypothetical protein NEPAR07_1050 [Nematocida parisii]|eukprot:XP_013059537.1 hypothetical protein NEPG_01709 [Nematocida parisii ERTm1]